MRSRNIGRMLLALVLSATLILSGCSTNWVDEAEQIVSVLIPAAGNVVTLVALLQGKTVTAEDLQTIQNAGTQAQADLQLIQSLIAAYGKADAAAKPGIMNQMQSAIGAVGGNLQELLGALHIKDAATQTKITAAVGIVLSEVQSLAAVIPIVQGSGARGQGSVQLQASPNARGMTGQKKAPLSANEFVKSFNSTLTARTGNAALDQAAAGLQIHLHGKVERMASAGVLK